MKTKQPLTEVECCKCGVIISLYPESDDTNTWATYASSNWWCEPCINSKVGN